MNRGQRKRRNKKDQEHCKYIKMVKHRMTADKLCKITLRHIAKWIRYCDNPGVIFDIGACVGMYSLYFAHFASSSIYSFEPVPGNFQLLMKNLTMNKKLQKKITAHNFGFWSSRCSKEMGIPQNRKDTDNIGLYTIGGHKKTTSASFEVLDEWCEDNQIYPDFIKIDAEGAEYEILRKGFRAIRSARYILCEHHLEYTEQDTLYTLLLDNGFEVKMTNRNNYFWEKK
ncbi:hypothetical protein LCGC14_1274480 [marine sediment metagenome]|uniref:Methyltransferase FkbM domain-containing protein n=1 Tax=marine sediment metagenome TaxID=412755 RepID=A0A0F9NDU1_9ZZZZ